MLLPEEQIKTSVPGWSGFLASQTLAAAEWIVREGHGEWVRRACQRYWGPRDEDGPPRGKWNLEYWQMWKSIFRDVSLMTDGKRVDRVVCKETARAFEIMTGLDKQYV